MSDRNGSRAFIWPSIAAALFGMLVTLLTLWLSLGPNLAKADNLDTVEAKVQEISVRVARMEVKVDTINEKIVGLEEREGR